MGSQQGGVDIEQVAKETPEAIIKYGVDIHDGQYQWVLMLSIILTPDH